MKRILLVLSFCCTLSMTAQISDYVTGLTSPVGLAQSGTTLFVADVGTSKIQKIDMTATNPVAVDFVNNISFATKMVIIGNDLYFTSLSSGGVSKVDITLTNPPVIPVISGLNSPFGLVVKDNYMYVSLRSFDNGGIVRFDYTQTNPTAETIITGLSAFVNDIDIYGNDLYMARGNEGISKIDISQSNPTLEVVVAASGVLEVAIKDNFLYYSNNYISRINLLDATPNPESILSGIGPAWDLHFDGTDIFLAQQNDNKISKLNTTFVDPVLSPDYDALVSLYNSTDGDNWTSSTNWFDLTKSLYSWQGVVTNENNKVVGINLYGNNLTGNLPTEIGNLDQLEVLNLNSNMLTGDLPPTTYNLTNLSEISLGSNEFTGTIPSEIGNFTNLTFLNLSTNNFEGTLPSSLSNLSNLTNIFISLNYFEGAIPFNAPNANIYATLNNFDFSDLEPFILANNYAFFQYSPQRTPDVPETIEMGTELDITFTIQDENINRESENTAMNNEYQWFKDDVLITDATNNTFTILNTQESDSGIYHCEITNTIVADLVIERADISLTVDSSLSINDNDIVEFKTYPNPVKNWLTLDIGIQDDFEISLADINGKIILEQTFNTSIASLDLSSLSSGLYILKLSSENKQITKKIIKK